MRTTWCQVSCGLIGVVLCIFLLSLPLLAQKKKPEESTDYYKKWLDEDVVYIISSEERAVFEKLTTDDEKDAFMEQFWRRRDPDPRTAENEFKEEHYRRIQYANERLTSGKPGWRTDRGRTYIRFGPPDQLESNSGGPYIRKPWEGGGVTSTYPFEVWWYRDLPGVGGDVELEFVDSTMTGDYHLAMDGEEKDAFFYVAGIGLTADEEKGLSSKADRVQYRFWGNPDNFELNPDKIRFRYRRIQDQVWYKFGQLVSLSKPPQLENPKLKELVEARVFYPEDLPVQVDSSYLRLDESQYIVPISLKIQNKDLTYTNAPPDRQTAEVSLYLKVADIQGRVYYEFDDSIFSNYAAAEFARHNDQYSVYQRMLRLPPGRYKAELVVQHEKGKKIGQRSFGFLLPDVDTTRLAITPPIVASYLTRLAPAPTEMMPFVIGNEKVVPSFGQAFKPKDRPGVYFHAYGFEVDQTTMEPDIAVRMDISDQSGKVLNHFEGDGRRFFVANRLVVAQGLPLTNLAPGRYTLKISIEDRIKRAKAATSTDFTVAGE